MQVVFVIFLAYAFVACLILLYGMRQLHKARLYRDTSRLSEALALYWAWAGDKEFKAVSKTWPDRGFKAAPNDQVRRVYSLLPLNLLGLLAVALYQLLSNSGLLGARPKCIYCPNCSNFALGVLHRQQGVGAYKRIIRRLKSCNGREFRVEF